MQNPQIAYFSPMPPKRTGIADYSADLLPYLKQQMDFAVVSGQWSVVSGQLAIYQMGNSPFHNWIYDRLKVQPGVVVLHDWVLQQFMGQRDDFAREVMYALGAQKGRAVLMGEEPLRDPLNRRVLDLALGLIVHSDYMAILARREHPDLPIVVAPMPMAVHGAARTLGERVTFGMVGQVTQNKQIDRCLRVFGRYHTKHPNSQLVIVGESADFDLQASLDKLPSSLRDAVDWRGYVADSADFRATIDQIDIVLNLRHPTNGETSAAALRALAQGKPVIVNDVGWYSELPDTVARKVSASDDDQLLSEMTNCVEKYGEMSMAAIDYIRSNHAPEETAKKYVALLEKRFR